MLVVKLESGGKVVGRMNVINEDASMFVRRRPSSPLCDYSYETKLRKGLFAPRIGGRLRDHFREQSVWVLMNNILEDMDRHGRLSKESEVEKNSPVDAIRVELWPDGDESESVEVGRIKLTPTGRGYRYELADPEKSPWALKGSGALADDADHLGKWRLLADVLGDMEQTGMLKPKTWTPNQQPS